MGCPLCHFFATVLDLDVTGEFARIDGLVAALVALWRVDGFVMSLESGVRRKAKPLDGLVAQRSSVLGGLPISGLNFCLC